MSELAARPTLHLPRRLAISLLHEAQIAGDKAFFAAVGSRGGPQTFVLLDVAEIAPPALQGAREALSGRACELWAIYLHRPASPSAPTVSDFATEPELLRLTSSLATKGVLQLRAWRLIEARVLENPLHVED